MTDDKGPNPVPTPIDPAERRTEPRLWCSELVEVFWTERGRHKRAPAVLEDISHKGACLQIDVHVTSGTKVRIEHPSQTLEGEIRYCIYRETGYFVGVKFDDGFLWNEKLFQPQHLLDPNIFKKVDEDK
jgi:hypothetical protein